MNRRRGHRRGSPSDSRRVRLGNLLVLAQFTLIVLCMVPVSPALDSGPLRLAGWLLACAGGIVGALALVVMRSDLSVHPMPGRASELRTSGIYAVVRHPMYLAVLLFCSGVTLVSGRALSLGCLVLLCLLLSVKARWEDRMLSERFGCAHTAYAGSVPAIVPRSLSRLRPRSARRSGASGPRPAPPPTGPPA